MKKLNLRPYQKTSIEFIKKNNGGLIVAGTGAGKTLIGITAIDPFLVNTVMVICPRTVQKKWEIAIKENFNTLSPILVQTQILVIDKQTKTKRIDAYTEFKELTEFKDNYDINILILRYGHILADAEELFKLNIPFNLFIMDESHTIKNHTTKTFKALKHLFVRYDNITKIMLTATPQSKGAQDLWTTLNLLNRHLFNSYWRYINKFMVTRDNEFQRNAIIGLRRSTHIEFQSMIKPYILKIPDKDIKKYTPAIVRQELYCELDTKTMRVYKELKEQLIVEIGKDLIITPNVMVNCIKLRQLLVCPKLLSLELGYGVGIDEIAYHAKENEDQHIVIFSPFPSAFPFLEIRLREKFGYTDIFELRGGMKTEHIPIVCNNFARKQNSRSALFCSIDFSVGFDLFTAKNCYFLHFDWKLRSNEQAEGRLKRGDKTHANAFYLFFKNTIDKRVQKVLETNKHNTNATFKNYIN